MIYENDTDPLNDALNRALPKMYKDHLYPLDKMLADQIGLENLYGKYLSDLILIKDFYVAEKFLRLFSNDITEINLNYIGYDQDHEPYPELDEVVPPLHWAVLNEAPLDLINELIRCRADVNLPVGKYFPCDSADVSLSNSLLSYAFNYSKPEIFKVLISACSHLYVDDLRIIIYNGKAHTISPLLPLAAEK
jgi:hypothetical protein